MWKFPKMADSRNGLWRLEQERLASQPLAAVGDGWGILHTISSLWIYVTTKYQKLCSFIMVHIFFRQAKQHVFPVPGVQPLPSLHGWPIFVLPSLAIPRSGREAWNSSRHFMSTSASTSSSSSQHWDFYRQRTGRSAERAALSPVEWNGAAKMQCPGVQD